MNLKMTALQVVTGSDYNFANLAAESKDPATKWPLKKTFYLEGWMTLDY